MMYLHRATIHKLLIKIFLLVGLVLMTNTGYSAKKTKVNFSISKVYIGVDLNRDGKIEFDKTQATPAEIQAGAQPTDKTFIKNSDGTLTIIPFRFWLNNDLDVVNNNGKIEWYRTSCEGLNGNYNSVGEYQQTCEQWDEDPVAVGTTNTSGNKQGRIESYRDLEDFSPLKIKIDTTINSDEYQWVLQAKGLGVNVFKGVWDDNGDNNAHSYIYDANITKQQMKVANTIISTGSGRLILRRDFERKLTKSDLTYFFDDSGLGRFIFEGAVDSASGCQQTLDKCYIAIKLKKKDVDKPIIEKRVYLDFHDIKDYYQHVTAGTAQISDNVDDFEAQFGNQSITQVHGKKLDIYNGLFKQSEIDKDLVVQIHGWRMRDAEKINFAETSFKRLYWSGYKGQFTALSWPTGWHTKPANKYGAEQLPYVLFHEQNYNNSEAVARKNAPKLEAWLKFHAHGANSHSPHTNLHIIAHSMGNVLVSETLMSLPENIITSYTASQAATSAGSYNSNAVNVDHALFDAKYCDYEPGTKLNPEQAWRCYNIANKLLPINLVANSTVFDMPPDMWRYDSIKRNTSGQPIDMDLNIIPSDGNYIVEHGPTDDVNMGPNDLGNHYYKNVGTKTRILNFFNTQDAALTGWEFNQLTKPDLLGGPPTWGYTNTYHEQYQIYERAYLDCLELNIDNPQRISICDSEPTVQIFKPDEKLLYQAIFQRDDIESPYNDQTRIDILSHIIPARTEPLGQQLVEQVQKNNTAVEIFDNPEMGGFTNSNQDHSAPFHGYYSQVSPKNNKQSRARYWNVILDISIYPITSNSDLTKLANSIGLE